MRLNPYSVYDTRAVSANDTFRLEKNSRILFDSI